MSRTVGKTLLLATLAALVLAMGVYPKPFVDVMHATVADHRQHRPCVGSAPRSNSRNRRFMRLRTTALPIFLVTVIPKRMPLPSFGRVNSTNPARALRRPLLARRKSARLVMTEIMFGLVTKTGSRREPASATARPQRRGLQAS